MFLDRDGVLIHDANLLSRAEDIQVLEAVPQALRRLKDAGFLLIIVSNQAIVARGLMSPEQVVALQTQVQSRLMGAGSPTFDGFYFCPHHPNATLRAYRENCDCRKHRAGLLRQAAAEHGVDLATSFMVGDRLSDVAAGARVGCRTVLVQTGAHKLPNIDTQDEAALDSARPDLTCAGLDEAAAWILHDR